MNITLKMKIQEQDFDVKVDLTMKAGRIYRQQFNRDLIKDMTEIYNIVKPSPFEGIDIKDIDIKGKSEEEIYQILMSRVDIAKLAQNRNIILDYSHTEQASQIIWAFAKNADESLPNYEEWIDGFDFVLPVKDIIATLYMAWGQTAQPTIEVKN